ncbi:hypothetical protein [Sabulicella glaciei]|uniref:Uncharacterized protein n=1 Tax=Sabulicella glaciei TaxID=2984948 RepID=A0ABT3NWT3_9PROT|nr:hypothetical protein [Roseococcus sp. MDT2-1-1]MCW8086616.1 hypothetical protein [Roseococcus sp. MDT2-1-1]
MPRDEPLLPLSISLPHAHIHYFAFSCRRCGRSVDVGIRRAVRLCGDLSTEEFLARMRCRECGHRGALITVHGDPRPPDVVERDGPLPVTLEE